MKTKQFLYDIGDRVVLRGDIPVGTYCGGVTFDEQHDKLEFSVLTIEDKHHCSYGNFYTAVETDMVLAEDDIIITDTMIDQLATKKIQNYDTNKPIKLVIGRTASGKDTFVDKMVDEEGLSQVLSYTTRPRRAGEGDTHKFIDNTIGYGPQWVKSEINGYEYFVLPQDVKYNDVFIVDPVGFDSLMTQPEFNRDIEVYYLMVDPETRQERFLSRDNVDKSDFYSRDESETDQFTEFESRLQNSYFREKYNIRVFTSETRGWEPIYRELTYDGPYCEASSTGGWVILTDEHSVINPIERANDFIEYLLSKEVR